MLLQHPLAIPSLITWLGFTPFHFMVDESLQQMVSYLWRFQEEERDESLQTLHVHVPSYHPHHHHRLMPKKEKKVKRWIVNNKQVTHQIHLWAFPFCVLALRSLEKSALTLSIHSSCVNTNIVSVKNYTHTHTRMRCSSGTAIILFTIHSHDSFTSTLLISHNFTQQLTEEWVRREYDRQTG